LKSQVIELEEQTKNPCYGDEKEDNNFIVEQLSEIRENFKKI